MPFERYFQPDSEQQQQQQQYYEDARTSSHNIQFQIPHFLDSDLPMLAPGGGAEVLPPGMFNNQSWLANNGFIPMYPSAVHQKIVPTPTPPPVQLRSQIPASDTPQNSVIPVPQDLNSLIASGVLDPQQPLSTQHLAALASATSGTGGLSAPSAFGLPLYSASGFDLLSVMAKVATRPNPTVNLGPVDLTSSFVVVDVRRHDQPIIYCSPSFCRLTGYSEREVLGRNCRFLQSPDGVVVKGEHRRFSSNEAAQYLRKSLSADKECQTSIINYRKGGSAFINLVTVIPIVGEDDKVVYYVGFQVDLTEQPNVILEKLRDGTYMVNFAATNPLGIMGVPSSANSLLVPKKPSIAPTSISKALQPLLDELECSVIMESKEDMKDKEVNHPLSLLLLSALPDFIHVLSLKGSFLYVAPSITHVLGYTPGELVGKALTEICHPADVVPVMRELKESSSVDEGAGKAKQVDLLFRAMNKDGTYVWVESRGRLHVEPGKGRKAIVLSGRVRGIVDVNVTVSNGVYGMMSSVFSGGKILSVCAEGLKEMLGYEREDLMGRSLTSLIGDERDRALFHNMLQGNGQMRCRLVHKNETTTVDVGIVLYRTPRSSTGFADAPLVYHLTPMSEVVAATPATPTRLFEELHTGRNSSWQYELQQLRIRNQQLGEEIKVLEEGGWCSSSASTPSSSASTPAVQSHGWEYSHLHLQQPQSYPPRSWIPPPTPPILSMPVSISVTEPDPWRTHAQMMQQHHQTQLKRTWDAANEDGGGG